jgi:prephenate dehydrogenase
LADRAERSAAAVVFLPFYFPYFRLNSGVLWEKVALVGVGLLGGSLGLAIRQRRLAKRVVGFVRRAASVRECARVRAVDLATLDLQEAIENADLVVLCTPIAQMLPLTRRMLPALKRGAIVTDVGSVKGSVVRELEPLMAKAGAHFVGSHPMAGSEKTGVSAAKPDLFAGAVCVLTSTRKSNRNAVRRVGWFWRAVGARPIQLPPALHDVLVCRSSHLPHVVAAALVNHVLGPSRPDQQALLCANGFRDTTRIASSSTEMWRDISLANRKNLAKEIEAFIADLRQFQRSLREADLKAATWFFETAKQRRDRWCTGKVSSSPE